MKFVLSNILILSLTLSQLAFGTSQTELSELVRKYDYQLQTTSLSEAQKLKLSSSMELDLKKFSMDKSSEDIIHNLNGLIQDMPEGSEKSKILKVMSENKHDPELALEEIVNLNLLIQSQSGDSANWSLSYTVDQFIQNNMILSIAILAVGITASVVYTNNIKKKKNKVLDDQIAEREQAGDYAGGVDTSFNGSAEFQPASFDQCKLSDPSTASIVQEATLEARATCQAEPRVDQNLCRTNKPFIYLKLVAGNRCVATASVRTTILRID